MLLVSFAFAIVVFKVRISGSVAGFLGVGVACALMASAFGLLSRRSARRPTRRAACRCSPCCMMVMLGGAWVPTFVFPAWLQQVTVVVPARWAVDGLDAMTWRGIGLERRDRCRRRAARLRRRCSATIAVSRFRWEEA